MAFYCRLRETLTQHNQLSNYHEAVGQIKSRNRPLTRTFYLHRCLRALSAALDDVPKEMISSGSAEKFHFAVQSNLLEGKLRDLVEHLNKLSSKFLPESSSS
jgi:hypothetical protein